MGVEGIIKGISVLLIAVNLVIVNKSRINGTYGLLAVDKAVNIFDRSAAILIIILVCELFDLMEIVFMLINPGCFVKGGMIRIQELLNGGFIVADVVFNGGAIAESGKAGASEDPLKSHEDYL